MKRRLGSLGILASIALLASAVPAGAQDIRVGAVYPFSGALGALGNAAYAGAEVAVAVVNEAGGVNGRKIVLIKADAPTPAEATNETQRLLTQENIKILIGSYSSSISLAASAVAERNQALWMEMGSMADQLTGRNFRRTFRTSATTGQVAEQAVRFIVEAVAPVLKVQPATLKVAIIHEDWHSAPR